MTIAICGAGWLGLPLALSLVQQGHQVNASKRKTADIRALPDLGIKGFVYNLGDDLTPHPLFADNHVLIINIAPGRRHLDRQWFMQQMQHLIRHARNAGTEKLIFISTTSVYGQCSGTVTETTQVAPQTDSALAHVQIENFAREVFGHDACILRLAGLAGEDRHPIRTLSGRQLTNGDSPVNLVHRQDVISAIEAILSQQLFGQTLHLCSQQHPRRKDYYSWCAEQLGLEPPVFDGENPQLGKCIDATESITRLGITLNYPSPRDMLNGLSL